jgi:hypothetical protein
MRGERSVTMFSDLLRANRERYGLSIEQAAWRLHARGAPPIPGAPMADAVVAVFLGRCSPQPGAGSDAVASGYTTCVPSIPFSSTWRASAKANSPV